MKKHMVEQTLPAGEYYIGDPCYVIEDERWGEFLEPYFDLAAGGVFEFDEAYVAALPTKYGDGCYPTSHGASLGVDAGMIGAVPVGMCSGDPHDAGCVVTFREKIKVRYHDGTLMFGHIEIRTGDDDEECPYCGGQCCG